LVFRAISDLEFDVNCVTHDEDRVHILWIAVNQKVK